jgi:hypothetical protein
MSCGKKTISEDCRVSQHPDIASRTIDGQEVVVVPATRKLQILNEVATRIWELCDGRSVGEITDAIVQEFDVEPAEARRDALELVEDMHERGMVVIE